MSEEIKAKKVQGSVYIFFERCKGCGFCVEFCPAKCLELSKDFNGKGYHPPVLIRETDCTGCDLCGMLCPDFAIYGFRIKNID
jgi:2-oxoglutarate ferredoxin oxidoreductase subunit delta